MALSGALIVVFLVGLACHVSVASDDNDIRLPQSIIPENYRIKMLPILEEGDFRLFGSVRMDFRVKEATDRIVLHAVNLTVDNVNVRPLVLVASRCLDAAKSAAAEADLLELKSDPEEPSNNYQISYDADKDFVIIQLPWTLTENRRYRIDLNYRGMVSESLDGLYRVRYLDRSTKSKKWLAVTQMEPTDARRVFPCLDEPAMKATFEMIIGRNENMTTVSNMPIERSFPMRNKDGWFWDYYEKSVPMSTYLVACLISDFEFREAPKVTRQVSSTSAKSTTVRIWAQRDLINQTELALRVTGPMLEFLERYFQVDYPLPKADLVAVPDFSAGAMENWGLITFRETALLVDPKASSSSEQLNVEKVIAHELAHQWFGNLVTMKWWNDLWLNEGFATYVQRLVLENVSPAYQYGTLQELDFLGILGRDSLDSSHPISVEVKHPKEIGEIFDGVSYTKGCAVIRMMNHFVGEPTFRQALSNYLQQMRYRNAEQDDLWRFMTQQAHADGVLDVNMDVKSIMDTWTLQMGFPLITITRDYGKQSISMLQNRFLRTTGKYLIRNADRSSKMETREAKSPKYLWWVPVSLTDAVERDFGDNNTQPRLWLPPDPVIVSQDVSVTEQSWIIANIQGTGYFRVNYDERNWKLLADQLFNDHRAIHVLNRAHLISDAFALAANNILPYTTPFDLIQYLKNEDHYVPWQSAMGSLSYVGRMFRYTSHYGRYEAFMSSLVRPAYIRIGVLFKNEDDPISQFARESLTREACTNGYRPCIQRAQDLFEDWMNSDDPLQYQGIRPDARLNTYCTAIKYGGLREWDFAWQMALNVTSSQQRSSLLAALGCSREPWILIRYLSYALEPNSGIRKQDGRSVISSVAGNIIGRNLAYNFIRDHFDDLMEIYTIHRVMEALSVTSNSFNRAEELKSLEDFLAFKADSLKNVQSTSRNLVTTVAANVDWMNRNADTLAQWFKSKGF